MEFGLLKMFGLFHKADEDEYVDAIKNNLDSITGPKFDDGAIEIEQTERQSSYQGVHNTLLGDLDPAAKNTRDLINTYRGLPGYYEVDNAIQEIVTDAIVYENGHDVVSLDLGNTAWSEKMKERLYEEFDVIQNALNFQRKGPDHFRRWYIDSRIFFHKIVNPKNTKEGIQELRRLDPRNIQFVREVITETEQGIKVVKGHKDYFIYDTGHEPYQIGTTNFSAGTKIKIPASAIVYAHSGLVDCNGRNIIGYLHRAVKPVNQLKLLEDSMVIYRLTRAPDRRVFYIDTGNMPARKAQQHMQTIMQSMRNRVVYDAATGKIKNSQNNMSLTEDYWLQRRDGKAVTEVDTLPGMSGMSEMDDILYFRKALYMALRVPLSRIPDDQNGGIQFDAGTTISRDELRFSKFIQELQHKFSEIFLDPLKTNLILKNVITEEEWENELNNIKVVFHRDSYFTELKDAELTERRINLLNQAEPYIGKYISHNSAMKQFLGMTDEEIEEERKLILEEQKDPIYKVEEEEI